MHMYNSYYLYTHLWQLQNEVVWLHRCPVPLETLLHFQPGVEWSMLVTSL